MKRRIMTTLAGIVAVLALAYLGIVALMFFQQDKLVYFPPGELTWRPSDAGVAFEDVWLETEDGVRLHGWFVPAEDARGTVLYFHGNASNISKTSFDVDAFQRLNLNAFLLDYRGYGQSEGTPGEAGLYRDAAAAWRYLTEERNIASTEIIIAGHSLGGGVATWLAQQHTPAAVILMSTFTTMPDVGAEHYPFLPVRQLARNHYPNIDRLPTINAPVLIVHGQGDDLIPFSHAEQLFAVAPEPKWLLPLEGGHDRGFATASEQHPDAIKQFLDKALTP